MANKKTKRTPTSRAERHAHKKPATVAKRTATKKLSKKPVRVAPRSPAKAVRTVKKSVSTKGHVVVLGGGPAGLAAALRLQEQGIAVTLVEQKDFVGGAGATQKLHGCLVDYGPHLFHPTTKEITDLVKQYSGDDYFEATMINKLILKGKTFTYPFRMQEAVTKLSPFLNARIVADYAWTKTVQRIRPKQIQSFEDWGVQSFGRTLYEMCFGSYTGRVWGRHPKTISARLAKEKLSALSLRKIVKNFFMGNPQTEGYLGVRVFGYHKDGIGAVYRNMAVAIEQQGGTVLMGSVLDSIEHRNGHVTAVTVRKQGKRTTIAADAVITTVPLTQLYESMRITGPTMTHANALEYRDILFVNYLIRRDKYSDAHMIYLLDTHFQSNRMAEQKNATARASPEGKTLLTFELPCQRGEALWNDEAEIYRRTIEDLRKLGVAQGEIEHQFVLRFLNAYPVFSVGYEHHLAAVKDHLAGFDNLLVAGRQGLYLNIDMHDSMRLGRLAADHFATKGPSKEWIPTVNEFLASLKL